LRDVIVDTTSPAEDNRDTWQLPEQTIERGAGDCEDLTLLLIYRARENNITMRFVCIRQPGGRYHAMAEFDGRLIESTEKTAPVYVEDVDGEVIYILSYETAIGIAYFW